MNFPLFRPSERKRELILKDVESAENDKLIFFSDEETMLACVRL